MRAMESLVGKLKEEGDKLAEGHQKSFSDSGIMDRIMTEDGNKELNMGSPDCSGSHHTDHPASSSHSSRT
jgi:hypothetical protein